MKGIMTLNQTDQELIQKDLRLSKKPVPTDLWNVLFWLVVIIFFAILMIGSWQSLFLHSTQREIISQPVAAARAEIQLSTTVGLLDVSMNRAGQLVDASLEMGSNDRLEKELTTRDGKQFVRLEAKTIRPRFMPTASDAQWFVKLAPNIPLDLRIKTGIGAARLDLADLKITNLTVDSGLGQLTVILPNSGRVMARIQDGIGDMNILIPSGMKAQIRTLSGTHNLKMLGDFKQSGNVYTANGFVQSNNQVQLELRGDIGRIRIEEAEW